VDIANANSLTYNVVAPSPSRISIPTFNCSPTDPDILFLLNFTTAQRSALLTAPSTFALLYTPTNEHFGIGPIEGMVCGLPILATNTGGPTESVVDQPREERTGWLCAPSPQTWADALSEIMDLSAEERQALNTGSRNRARDLFVMESMAKGLEFALQDAVSKGPVLRGYVWLQLMFALIIAYVAGRSTFYLWLT